MTAKNTGSVIRATLSAGLACLAMLAFASQAAAGSYSPNGAFYWSMPGGDSAAAIATSPDGNFVYAADATARRIVEFDSDGLFLRSWSYRKSRPSSVTTDGSGNVYVLYPQSETIVKYRGDGKKILASWNVPFAAAIAATRGGSVFVLTNFLNAVGEYNTNGKAIGGFVANLPGQWFPEPGFDARYWPQSGYDPPYKTVAKEIAVDASGHPVVVGASYQALSDSEPDCSVPDHDLHIDTHPYPDPLISGEAARFTPGGSPIAYGWLSESQQNCFAGLYQQSPGLYVANGWQSDATNPEAVAVDPNTGEVYATSDEDLGAIHLDQSLLNTNANLDAPSYYCSSIDCPARDWDLLADNPPAGVAVDCHSNLYMLGGGAASSLILKFINQAAAPPGSCSTLGRFTALPPTLAVFKFQVGKIGKGTVWAGCSGRLCAGTLSLKSDSALCRNCVLSHPRQFHIGPGLQRALSLQLTRVGRRLLHAHPGLPIKILGRLNGRRTFSQKDTLREPSTLGASCRFPGSSGGASTVSGILAPGHGGERITIQYLPPQTAGSLIPAVQRTVLTDRAGRFHDHYELNRAGKWVIAVTWAGDRTHQPAAAPPCSGTLQPIQTHITLTCPAGSSAGLPTQFSGTLAGTSAGASVALGYVAPPGQDIGHEVSAGGTGGFSDSFSPPAPGIWLALAHYRGDAAHAPATAVCQFVVAPDDFSITVTPSAGSAQQGGSVNATVGTAVTSGAAQPLALSASGSPGGVTFSPTSITSGGSSSVSLAVPANATPGTYSIILTASGPWASHSTTYTLTVLAPSSLTLQCTADPNRHFISCTGRLTSEGAGIGGAQIKLTYQPPGGASPTVDTATTAPDGSYTDTLNAPVGSLLASGNWQVQAQYGGDATHAPASNTQTVAVP